MHRFYYLMKLVPAVTCSLPTNRRCIQTKMIRPLNEWTCSHAYRLIDGVAYAAFRTNRGSHAINSFNQSIVYMYISFVLTFHVTGMCTTVHLHWLTCTSMHLHNAEHVLRKIHHCTFFTENLFTDLFYLQKCLFIHKNFRWPFWHQKC